MFKNSICRIKDEKKERGESEGDRRKRVRKKNRRREGREGRIKEGKKEEGGRETMEGPWEQ